VSKRTVFYAPFVGWNMMLCRYVSLVRGAPESIQRMMGECRRWLRGGMSLMLFPEGTRSRDGVVGTFKHGAFTLAMETGVAVVPIAVHGTHRVLPKHGAGVATRADLKVEVLDPVAPDGFTDPLVYGEHVRRCIVAALGQEATEPARVV
jgi:1-acyl-sn-glycerol-3-phosphate acyltransferase